MTQDRFSHEIEASGRKLAAARKARTTVWRYAALLGAGGWLLVVPVVGGAYLGRWLDGRGVGGGQSWTLTLILLGLGLGIYNFWSYYRRGSGE
jgi:ATP synthase protein I